MNLDYEEIGKNAQQFHDTMKGRTKDKVLWGLVASQIIAESGLLEEVERLRVTIKRVDELAGDYESRAEKLKNTCECHDCGNCAAQLHYEDKADAIREALKGTQ